MYQTLEEFFQEIVRYGVLVLDVIGAVIIFVSAVRALLCAVKQRGKGKTVFSEGTATALSFLLGSEVLKTITAPGWREIGMTCAIFVMRAAMALLLHWENKHDI